MFLWHFPWAHAHWYFSSALPFGARTFLSPPAGTATAWNTFRNDELYHDILFLDAYLYQGLYHPGNSGYRVMSFVPVTINRTLFIRNPKEGRFSSFTQDALLKPDAMNCGSTPSSKTTSGDWKSLKSGAIPGICLL